MRWNGDPQAVIEPINALGYGLTIGIQTRIDSRAQALARASHVGNVYIDFDHIETLGLVGLAGVASQFGGLAAADVAEEQYMLLIRRKEGIAGEGPSAARRLTPRFAMVWIFWAFKPKAGC